MALVVHALWHSEDDTQAFAQGLARCSAIRDVYIELQGQLGTGKTTLVRHLLRALGVQAGDLSIWHFDFYRFSDPREWEDAGFRDIFASPGLKLAEWPSQAAGSLPMPDLTVAISLRSDGAREVVFTASSPAGRRLIEGLPHAL